MEGNRMNVYVVIPSINGAHLLKKMLPSLDVRGDQIIVVDQGSDDGTQLLCEEFGVYCSQNHERMTFTEACNKGISIALNKGADVVLICNNDIEFKTKVSEQLVAALNANHKIGLAAPTQVIRSNNVPDVIVYGVQWDLSKITFEHVLTPPVSVHSVVDSDFCEFTCVAIKREVLAEVGFLDDDYGFYHEDADYCYRASLKGYGCVYVQDSQIVHYASSTFNKDMADRKAWYINKNKILFAKKFLTKKVSYPKLQSDIVSSWSVINDFLHKNLTKYGLIDTTAPRLAFGHPGDVDAEYLYTVWETTKLPVEWRDKSKNYKKVFVPSRWNYEVFKNSGYNNAAYVPLGVDVSIFNPYGAKFEYDYDFVFLSVCRNQYRKGLDVTLEAWHKVRNEMSGAGLVLYGFDINPNEISDQYTDCVSGKLCYYVFEEMAVTLLAPVHALTTDEVAALYRGADFLVVTSRSEGFGFTVAEALACGLPAIFPNYGATSDFIHEGALTISGILTTSNYVDKGYSDVGDWWEPMIEDVEARMIQAFCMSGEELSRLVESGISLIRSEFTWKNTVLSLMNELEECLPVNNASNSVVSENRILIVSRKFLVKFCTATSSVLGALSIRFGAFAYYLQHHGIKIAMHKVYEVLCRKIGLKV